MAVPPSPLKSNPVDLSPAERRTSHFSLSLDRDRTTSRIAAIRRGELKISAPIPMAESTGAFFGNTVATPQEERGSYIQCGGTPDLAQGEMTSTRTTSRRPSTPAEAIKSSMTPTKDTWEQPDRQGLARSTGSADGAVEPSAVPNERGSVSPQVLRHKFSSEDLMNRRSTMKRPTSPGASPPFATPIPLRNTPMSSNGNTATPTKKKQRRSGTIKSVFRRMFTSKRSRVDAAQGESPAAKPSPPRHEYHRSDPGMIPEGIATRGNGEGDNDQSPTPHQRNHSVPIRRFSENISEDPGTQTPIRAHLPFPMNVNAPQTSSPTRQRQVRPGIDASSLSPTHKRRATLPSVILPVSDDPSHNPFLDSPNITQPRGGASDAAQIGLALTTTGLNNGSSQKANPNRRSRSAGALRDLADRGNNQADSRRRSAEIRYWRASYLGTRSGSPVPSAQRKKASVSHAGTEAMPNRAEIVSMGAEGTSVRHGSDLLHGRERISKEREERRRSDTKMGDDTLEAFGFDPSQEHAADRDHSASTPRAQHHSERQPGLLALEVDELARRGSDSDPSSPSSLTERLEHLERDMRGFEQSLQRLRDKKASGYPTVLLSDAPKSRRRSRNQTRPFLGTSTMPGDADERPVRPHTPPSSSSAGTGMGPGFGVGYGSGLSPTVAYAPQNGMRIADDYIDVRPPTRHGPPSGAAEAFPLFSPAYGPPHEYSDAGSITPSYAAYGPSARYANPTGILPQSPDIAAHLTPLYEVLKYERLVRKNLEAEVRELRAEVMSLRGFVGRLVSASGSATDPTAESGHWEHGRRDTAWDDHEKQRERMMDKEKRDRMEEEARRHTSRFSGLDSVDGEEEEGEEVEDEEEETEKEKASEVFATAKEGTEMEMF